MSASSPAASTSIGGLVRINVTSFDWNSFRQSSADTLLQNQGYKLCARECSGCATLRNIATPALVDYPSANVVNTKQEETRDLDTSGSPPPSSFGNEVAVATRLSDEMLVYIRGMNIYTSEEELKNIELLHGGHMGASPNNHCTPVLDVFTLDCFTFIVTPICSPVTREMFHRVDDVLQFIGQILLGIHFMHKQDIAHRACSFHNIRTDAASNYLRQVHQSAIQDQQARVEEGQDKSTEDSSENLETFLASTTRNSSPQPQFYINSLASSLATDPNPLYRAAGGVYCSDTRPPEFGIPGLGYNPFQLDICLIGYMFQDEFLNVYSNLEFCRKLFQAMTHKEPSWRPDASECLKDWCGILQRVSPSVMGSNLRRRKA